MPVIPGSAFFQKHQFPAGVDINRVNHSEVTRLWWALTCHQPGRQGPWWCQTEPAAEDRGSPSYCPHYPIIKSPYFFHFYPFLDTWLSANRYSFSSQCPIHPLSFIPQCCHCLFHITGHRRCNYLANIGLPLAERSRRSWWWGKVFFSNNQGKWVTPERIALNANAEVERGGVLRCNMCFSGFGGQSLVRKSADGNSLQWQTKQKLLQTQESQSLLYLEAPWVWKLLSA